MKQINEKLLNYALISLMKDKISVIPVGKDKRPLINWKEFQDRFATPEEVQGWFDVFDDPQIGFVTGKISNLTVVDIEKGGDASFLPQETMVVGTGGQGFHYYYLFEEGVNNKARIKDLVDIRGEGGYVVAPNSVSEKGPYTIIKKVPLLAFPKELFPKKEDIFQYQGLSAPIYVKKEITGYQGHAKGQRNDEMARYIGYVLTQIHPSNWDGDGWQLIQQANMMNIPPLSNSELKTTWESIKRVEVRNNPFGRSHSAFSGSYGHSSVEEEPQMLDDEDDDIKHIAEVADAQKLDQNDIYPLQMKVFDDAILGGVSPGDVIVIAGQTGEGKTTLAQDWTLSMVRGNKKAKALWFSYEVLPSHLWKKFQEMGMTREDCAFIPAKHSTGNVMWVEKKIKEGKEKFGVKTVFIDHLGFLLPKTQGILGKNLSSNYASFLTQVMRDLKTIALSEEVIIFLPVHMKKVDSKNGRLDTNDIKDSSGIGQESDLVFLIEREKEKDKDAKSYFTDTTRITLAKNRKTGMTVMAKFNMLNGRFAHDDSTQRIQEEFDNYGKENETKVIVPVIVPEPVVITMGMDIRIDKNEILASEVYKDW